MARQIIFSWTQRFCFFVLAFYSSSVGSQVWGESITVEVNESLSIEYTKYSTLMSWKEAIAKCEQSDYLPKDQHLLCFENRAQIERILPANGRGNVSLWLSSRSCSSGHDEECLSLNIVHQTGLARGRKDGWFFETSCHRKLNFICRKFLHAIKDEVVNNQQQSSTNQKLSPPNEKLSLYGKPCNRTQRRNIDWPEAPGNINSSIKCPTGMRGYATWFCNGTTGDWGPDQPNLGSCRSVAYTDVLKKSKLSQVVNLTETAQSLRSMVSSLQTGGDLSSTVEFLDKVDDIFLSQAPAMSPAQIKKVAEDTSNHVVQICNQLLTKSEAWKDLSETARYSTATTFLSAVDETGSVLASTIDDNRREITTKNVVLEVVKARGSQNEEITFQDLRPGSERNGNSLSVGLGPGAKHVVFALYADLREILPLHQEIETSLSKTVNSAVLSANISGRLHGKARITLKHFNTEFTNPLCVYWDALRQEWGKRGCSVVSTNESHTVCECDHLTNFAILMDVSCATCDLGATDRVALATITVIGCTVSIFCLSVCIVIFFFYRSLWGLRIMIHRNLCISLLAAQIILLGAVDRTENKTVCACIAGLLHFFFLSAFFWMFLEAFHILWLLIKVFTPKQSHVIKFYIVGYGFPALIVAVSAGSQPSGYGTPLFCWLNTQDGTIWAYVGPVLLIILFNTFALTYALYTTHRIVKPKEKDELDGLKMWVRGAAVLMPLLGVTWILGFFFIGHETVLFAYLFAALNSLQGLGIFLFHCVLNKKVKEHVFRSWERSSLRRSTIGRSSSKNGSSKSSSVKGYSSSPKRRRPTSKFFVSPDHSEPCTDHDEDVSRSPEEEEMRERGPRTEFLPPLHEKKDSLNTSELYPLEVER